MSAYTLITVPLSCLPVPVSLDASRLARIREATRPLPPISIQWEDGVYYIHDGRHRVAVARAHGKRTIKAYIPTEQLQALREA